MSAQGEIIVCVKPRAVRRTTAARAVSLPLRRPILSDADAVAVEEALRARERGEAHRVICVSAGALAAHDALIETLAMGADRVLRIDVHHDAALEAVATASLLAAAILAFGATLVLTAQRSDDGRSGLVPAFLARALGAAYLSNAVAMRLTPGEVEIQRRLGHGDRQIWSAAFPAVVAFDAGINLPRYPRARVRILARRRPIEELSPAALGVSLDSLPRSTVVVRLTPARVRPKKTALPAAGQSAAERLRAILSGGLNGKKGGRILKGPVEQLTAETLSFLNERHLLDD